MLKKNILFCFILYSLSAVGQSKTNGELVAEGTSKLKVKPDIIIFKLSVEKTDTIEKNAIKSLNNEIDDLVKTLYKIGFTNKSIKVSDYNISNSNYQYNDDNKKRYIASNVLKLEFSIDTKIIDAIYSEIEEAGLSDLDISFETSISDSLEKKTRLVLVQQAIQDAKINADNISKTLNIKLIRVKQVAKYKDGLPYNVDEISVVKFTPPKVIVEDQALSSKTSFAKFQIEESELEEKITIIYEVSNSAL
jgi:hypothetical protein